MTRRWKQASPQVLITGALLLLLALGATAVILLGQARATSVVGYFANSTGLYEGDEVRIAGVTVGQVDTIRNEGPLVRVEFHYDADQKIPADAKAAIVAPTLVTSRFIQLWPRYKGGPAMADGAVIPRDRTSVPVQWDEIQDQLSRLTATLGPNGADRSGSLSRAITTAADTLDGQGQSVNTTIDQLSQAMSLLADNKDDVFGTIRNLQVFVSALATSDEQIIEFNQRLASVSGVLADNRQQLGTALADLRSVVVTVGDFVRDNRASIGRTVSGLGEVTSGVVAVQDDLERALHVTPTPLANVYNAINPLNGAILGQLAASNFANPSEVVCSGIAAASNTEPQQAAQRCAEYLGPLLRYLTMNYPPIATNPIQRDGAEPVPASPGERTEGTAPTPALPDLMLPGGNN